MHARGRQQDREEHRSADTMLRLLLVGCVALAVLPSTTSRSPKPGANLAGLTLTTADGRRVDLGDESPASLQKANAILGRATSTRYRRKLQGGGGGGAGGGGKPALSILRPSIIYSLYCANSLLNQHLVEHSLENRWWRGSCIPRRIRHIRRRRGGWGMRTLLLHPLHLRVSHMLHMLLP